MHKGRKKLTPSLKRDYSINVSFNQSELSSIKTRALKHGVPLAVFIRQTSLDAVENLPIQVPEINTKRWIELSRSASNLNQIARSLNAHESVDIDTIKKALSDFRMSLISASASTNKGGDV